MRHHTRSRTTLALCIASSVAVLGACAGGYPAANTHSTPTAWTPLPCRACEQSSVAVDVRHSVRDAGRPGSYLFARVRNLNSHGVVLMADFRSDRLPDADGYVPGDRWRLALGPAGEADAEALLLLKSVDVATVAISGVERVTSRAEVTAAPRPR